MAVIVDNTSRKRFEYSLGESTAFTEYIITTKGTIFLTHTEVPKKARGKGIAFEMIEEILKEVKNRELNLVPLCPMVATFIRRNPKWKTLLADGYSV